MQITFFQSTQARVLKVIQLHQLLTFFFAFAKKATVPSSIYAIQLVDFYDNAVLARKAKYSIHQHERRNVHLGQRTSILFEKTQEKRTA